MMDDSIQIIVTGVAALAITFMLSRAFANQRRKAKRGNALADPIGTYFGWANLAYLTTVSYFGYFVDYRIFVAATSWVHYCKYIHQYYFRGAWGDQALYDGWKRDVLMYKTIALCNLGYIYLSPYYFQDWKSFPDFISLAMIVVGYYISIAATNALGINGTYFGIELGFVKADYCFVKQFPYNAIPHPMILGQVFALLGVFKVPHVHQAWPWLIPVHIALYLTHMTQEMFDFWKGEPWFRHNKEM